MRRCRLPGRAFGAPRHLPARGPGRRMRLMAATSRSRDAIAPGSSSPSILVPCLEPPADLSRRGGGRSEECQSGSPKWGALTERPPWRLWATRTRAPERKTDGALRALSSCTAFAIPCRGRFRAGLPPLRWAWPRPVVVPTDEPCGRPPDSQGCEPQPAGATSSRCHWRQRALLHRPRDQTPLERAPSTGRDIDQDKGDGKGEDNVCGYPRWGR
jgi:hypothetical protein